MRLNGPAGTILKFEMGIYYGSHIYGVRLQGRVPDPDEPGFFLQKGEPRDFMGTRCVEAAREAWQPHDAIYMYVDTSCSYEGPGEPSRSYKSWANEPDDILHEDEWNMLSRATWDGKAELAEVVVERT